MEQASPDTGGPNPSGIKVGCWLPFRKMGRII